MENRCFWLADRLDAFRRRLTESLKGVLVSDDSWELLGTFIQLDEPREHNTPTFDLAIDRKPVAAVGVVARSGHFWLGMGRYFEDWRGPTSCPSRPDLARRSCTRLHIGDLKDQTSCSWYQRCCVTSVPLTRYGTCRHRH